jgi:hypothetical protein
LGHLFMTPNQPILALHQEAENTNFVVVFLSDLESKLNKIVLGFYTGFT